MEKLAMTRERLVPDIEPYAQDIVDTVREPLLILDPSPAHDRSARDRQRLSGDVETILQKTGDSRESLLSRVRELLNDFAVPRGVIPTPDGDEAAAP